MQDQLFSESLKAHDGMLFDKEDEWYLRAKLQPKPKTKNQKPTQLELPMSNIALTPVKSSQIEAIGHDPETKTLAIKFKSGGLYHYANFSEEDYKALREADSVGSHFYRNIKPNAAKYPYTKQ